MSIVSASAWLGRKVAASDGDIGRCKDVLFDKEHWVVRYFVVDPHPWLPASQKVVLTPQALQVAVPDADNKLHFAATRQQIKKAPSLTEHEPISREFEEKFFAYYGYAGYWNEPGLFGTAPRTAYLVEEAAAADGLSQGEAQSQLRSVSELLGYDVIQDETQLGRLADLRLNTATWRITELKVEDKHLLHADEQFFIKPESLTRISWFDKTVNMASAV